MTTEHIDALSGCQQILLVGDSTDLPDLRLRLDHLPDDTYGQVIIEVASAVQIVELQTPIDVHVTWLVRDSHNGRTSGLAPRGLLAAKALGAWIREWMPGELGHDSLPVDIWVGFACNGFVNRVYRQLSSRVKRSRRSTEHLIDPATHSYDEPSR